jgi:carbon-monoxide dehydrogenase small subunit
MAVSFVLNGKKRSIETRADSTLYEVLRKLGCVSVKCGCETTNCGLCTVWLDGTPVLSCSVPVQRAEGRSVTTLEGLQDEAEVFGGFLAAEGGDQCGFCNPGFIMNTLAMVRELDEPTDDEILEYLSGNLCRCSGYGSHLRAIKKYLEYLKTKEA